jgi:hypothetical protein
MDLGKRRSTLKERVQSLGAGSGRATRRPIYYRGVASCLVVVALMSLSKSAASSTAVRSTQLWTVESGGFSIQVPASWKVGASSDRLCLFSASTTVVVGTPKALAACGGFNPVLEFGHGGPPFPPIPASNPVSEKINGVKVQLLRGTDALGGATPENYLLATLDGWTDWLLFLAHGKSPTTALAPAYRVLQTVLAPPNRKPAIPIREDFLGTWSVHGALLEISSESTGVEDLGGGAQCSPGIQILGCDIVLTLALSRAQDNTVMTATITRVKAYSDPTTFEIDPRSTAVPAVGNTFQLRFAEEHLMIETNLHYPWNSSGVFDPWWCDPSQVTIADNYCGD